MDDSIVDHSDTETTGSIPSANRSRSSSISTQSFPLAHPPPKSKSSAPCLRLKPKLLLQIQQVALNNRVLPVLEVWHPSRFMGKSDNLPKLHSKDIYITQSDSYTHLATSSSREDHFDQATVAVLCRGQKNEKAQVHFLQSQRVWEASGLPNGGYRFQLKDGDGALVWEKRPLNRSKEMSSSLSSTGSTEEKPRRFVLVIADQKKRRARIASLTKKGFKVSNCDRNQLDYLSKCLASSELTHAQFQSDLYTLILTMGVWVASQEGWLD